MAAYKSKDFCAYCLYCQRNRVFGQRVCTFGGFSRSMPSNTVPLWCPYKNDVEDFKKFCENGFTNLLHVV